MEFQDRILKCIDCNADFVFTAGEQLFFHDKQFKNEPKRCKACKAKRVSVIGAAPIMPTISNRSPAAPAASTTMPTRLFAPASTGSISMKLRMTPWVEP